MRGKKKNKKKRKEKKRKKKQKTKKIKEKRRSEGGAAISLHGPKVIFGIINQISSSIIFVADRVSTVVLNGKMDRQTEKQMDRWMDGQMDGWQEPLVDMICCLQEDKDFDEEGMLA